jgi:uncharacterized membrane protein
MSPSRLEAFSDGVFAIAITLLVLDIHVPEPSSTADLARELGAQWPSYVAYAVSFLTIGIIWINHHAMFHRLRAIDHGIMIRNLALLLCVGLLPFTTALMADYLKEAQGQHLAAAIYSGSFLLMSLAFAETNRHILLASPICSGRTSMSADGGSSWRGGSPGSPRTCSRPSSQPSPRMSRWASAPRSRSSMRCRLRPAAPLRPAWKG